MDCLASTDHPATNCLEIEASWRILETREKDGFLNKKLSEKPMVQNITKTAVESKKMVPRSSMDSADFDHYRVLYGITESDLEAVANVGEKLRPDLGKLVDDFYTWLPHLPEYERFFPDADSTNRVKELQKTYWTEFFRGRVNEEYFESRKRVGAVHATIGLSLRAYFAAMNTMLSLIFNQMENAGIGDTSCTRAITKLVHLDTSIVVDTFSELTNQTISQQSEAIMAMSTPVTAIWDNILLLPVVGLIDSRRAHDIMNAMLTRIKETEATVFILDISGVAAMDTAVANHLIKMTKAARLMGCTCIISGVSPAIASTVVELGIDVGTISTRANLKDALSLAFAQTGAQLVGRDSTRD